MITSALKKIKSSALKSSFLTRSALYLIESQPLLYLEQLIVHGKLKAPDLLLSKQDLKKEVEHLIEQDLKNIKNNLYDTKALILDHPKDHFLRLIKIYLDSFNVHFNKKYKRHKVFSQGSKEKLAQLPDYYKRNFHNQTEGYLSSDSAELYDHQVEILFRGTADSMRRMLIEKLARHHHRDSTLKIVEVGCGTGVSTYPLAKTYKNSKIHAVDLSQDYIAHASEKYKSLSNVEFTFGKGEDLSQFSDQTADVWCSTFVFHELPKDIRLQVLKEAHRILKPGGVLLILDSIQEHDRKDFQAVLDSFPQNFHEPFYKNYVKSPLEDLMSESGFVKVTSEHRFLSKICVGKKEN